MATIELTQENLKETVETKLVMTEELTSPEQLVDYTMEIVKNDAKNKAKVVNIAAYCSMPSRKKESN